MGLIAHQFTKRHCVLTCWQIYHSCAKIRNFHKSSDSLCSVGVANKFVPECRNVSEVDLQNLQEFLNTHRNLFILTGAGISTESGIPDYRSEGVGLYATSTTRPVQYADFLKSADIRKRYWARNYVGWPRFSSFQPNAAHYILSDWERKGRVHWLVTQNVDALHFKAGSQHVTELHGSAHRVVCLSCSLKLSRHSMQKMIKDQNPGWVAEADAVRPDGDVNLESEKVKSFQVPPCPSCGGVLKPEITFFGDNVPKDTVHFVLDKMFKSDALLVIGSSLEVYSGFRFINRASSHGMEIAILNIGGTRGDKHATIKVSGRIGDVLQQLTV
ncbi:NAD-dependent protein lipoamidase sirtuin-4, mitochondrial [Aplysia californica]|uniref:NAD-dependent protein deacylase n=1 Tax=Aplysia californica TaxID=6500 RepID=A0ABM0K6W7_APLCA|nr:NAD-dependent protein lipoamidase sirtuin-4, mitochondrial [Aplysia californica]